MRFGRTHVASALTGLVLGAVMLSVVPAVAGDHDPLTLGEKNTSKVVTRLNTRGGLRVDNFKPGKPALILNVAGDTAPMAVNSSALVANLNADQVDGMDGEALAAELVPFETTLDEGWVTHIYEIAPFDIQLSCVDAGTTPDSTATVNVESDVAWWMDGVAYAAGSQTVVSTTTKDTGGTQVMVRSATKTLTIDVVYLSAEDTDIDCRVVGSVIDH